MLKALDKVGLVWLTHLFRVAWRPGEVPLDWQSVFIVPIKKKRRTSVQLYRNYTQEKLMPGIWRGDHVVKPRIQRIK